MVRNLFPLGQLWFVTCVVRNLFAFVQLAAVGERHAGTIEALEARLEALSRSKVRPYALISELKSINPFDPTL